MTLRSSSDHVVCGSHWIKIKITGLKSREQQYWQRHLPNVDKTFGAQFIVMLCTAYLSRNFTERYVTVKRAPHTGMHFVLAMPRNMPFQVTGRAVLVGTK